MDCGKVSHPVEFMATYCEVGLAMSPLFVKSYKCLARCPKQRHFATPLRQSETPFCAFRNDLKQLQLPQL